MFARLKSVWRSLRHRSRFESDLDDEMRNHIEARADDLLRSGASSSREDAIRRARLEFGCVEAHQDRVRESRRIHWFEQFIQDVRFGIRLLRKTPAVTLVALLSLALGIGANTAIFSLLDAIVLRMLPIREPQQLVQIDMRSPTDDGSPEEHYTNPIWEQIRDHQNALSGVLAWSDQDFDLSDGGQVHNVQGAYASGDYFKVLGLRPAAGTFFTAADDRRGCAGMAVLSYGFWQSHYNGAENAIGSTLTIRGQGFQVIGITQPGFSGLEVGRRADIVVPICDEAILDGKNSMLDQRSAWWLRVMGRLKPGQTQQQATTALRVIAPQVFAAVVPAAWKPEYQKGFMARTFVTMPSGSGVSNLRRRYQEPLETLMFIVGLVLLIACANIASLMLARATARQQEIAVRLSIGASRSRLIRQVLTESLVLSVGGALLGILFAEWGGRMLVRFVSNGTNRVFLDLSMDWRVLGFTTAAAVVTGLLFGVLPALRATRVSLTSAIKGSDTGPNSRLRGGRWIVAIQVALSLILLVGTGLFIRSFLKLIAVDTGFDKSNVLLINTDIHNSRVAPEARLELYGEVLDRLRTIPGVQAASQSFRTPIQGLFWNEVVLVEGYKPKPQEDPSVYFNWITPGYFETLRTPLLRGRNFDQRDSATAPHVAIVNETMARRFFPNKDALGQYFRIDENEPDFLSQAPIQIIGIARDAKYNSLREQTLPSAYVPLAQLFTTPEYSTFELRTAAPAAAIASAAKDAIGSVNRSASLEFDTLDQQISHSLTQDRLLAMLSGFFGALALLLTAIGLYGVMAYIVAQRTHEIGIRMALGAQPHGVLRIVIWDVAIVLLVGVAAGVAGSFWVTRLAQQFLFNLKANDAATIVLAVAVMFAAGLSASYIPARRAMRVDPMVALRHE